MNGATVPMRASTRAVSGMARPLRALVLAAWRESFNQGWRFSPGKAGIWAALLQLGLASLALWRMSSLPLVFPAGSAVLLGGLNAALGAFLALFLRGRQRLYTGPLVALIHLSPTPA